MVRAIGIFLRGTGIFLVLFHIYPIVPYALAFCAQFLLNVLGLRVVSYYGEVVVYYIFDMVLLSGW